MDMKSLPAQAFTIHTFPRSCIIDFMRPGRIRRGHRRVELHAPICDYYRLPSLEPKIHCVGGTRRHPGVRMETIVAESISIDTVLKAGIMNKAV